MNYSPVVDIAVTVWLLGLAVALAYDLVVCWYFGRKSDELFRRGRMWGGE